MFHVPSRSRPRPISARGFSLVELLPCLAILSFLMASMLGFLVQMQKKFQGSEVSAESSMGARAAMEILTQDIGQAGYNTNFTSNRTCNVPISASGSPQCVAISDITGVNPGDWLSFDTGLNNEMVQVIGTTTSGACTDPDQVEGIFVMNHLSPDSTFPLPVSSFKLPYPTGILLGTGLSNDHELELYGDINDDGTIRYLDYYLTPTTSPATTVTIKGQTYVLYNLMRSITAVPFKTGVTENAGSPLVQNVLYQDISAVSHPVGPGGQPIFNFPDVYQVGIVPNQVSVVGTVNINLSVAVNPRSMETHTVQWFTMSSRIRPLNLAAAVMVSQSGGYHFLPATPPGLPMN